MIRKKIHLIGSGCPRSQYSVTMQHHGLKHRSFLIGWSVIWQAQLMTVYTALGIVHNCAKLDENKVLLRKCQFVEAAQPYTDTDKNSRELVMNAVMAISYVMEENQARIARINIGTAPVIQAIEACVYLAHLLVV